MHPAVPFEPLLSCVEAADLLQIHVVTLQRWSREGSVPCFRIGRRFAYRASELNIWLVTRYTSNAVRAAQLESEAA